MYITCYISLCIMPTDCLLIALDAHMFSHNAYAPGTRAPGLRSVLYILGSLGLGLARGPGPSSLLLNICASRLINGQSMGNQ